MPKLQRVVSFVGSLQRIRVVLAPLSVSDPVEYFLVNAVIGVVSSNLPLSLSLKYPSPPPFLEGLYCFISQSIYQSAVF